MTILFLTVEKRWQYFSFIKTRHKTNAQNTMGPANSVCSMLSTVSTLVSSPCQKLMPSLDFHRLSVLHRKLPRLNLLLSNH